MSFRPSRSLVTGASSGIGEAFAHALAARGSDLVLVARRKERLDRLASQLTDTYSIVCETVEFDLSVSRPGAGLRERVRGDIDLLVNNAGFAAQGPFLDGDAGQFAQIIAVDVTAMVDLCHAFLTPMTERRRGAVINVTSTTAFQPIPTLAVYSAAKAFVHSFSQSLWFEAKQHNVKVITLAPGPTRTEFFDVIGDNAAIAGSMQSPEQVVATAMRALDRRSPPPYVVSGRANSLTARIVALIPRRVLIPMVARMLRTMPATPESGANSAIVQTRLP